MDHLITRTPTRALGAKVRELRQDHGLSQQALAERAQVHASNLGKIERGLANPSIETIVRLARALDTSVSVLTEYITAPRLSPAPEPPNGRQTHGPQHHGPQHHSAIGHSSSFPSG